MGCSSSNTIFSQSLYESHLNFSRDLVIYNDYTLLLDRRQFYFASRLPRIVRVKP